MTPEGNGEALIVTSNSQDDFQRSRVPPSVVKTMSTVADSLSREGLPMKSRKPSGAWFGSSAAATGHCPPSLHRIEF